MNNEEKITKLLEELVTATKDIPNGITITINCETINFNMNKLENLPLEFHFDKVLVKENSGSISFGNNFGKPHQDEKKQTTKNDESQKNERADSSTAQDIIVKVNDRIVNHQFIKRRGE